MNRKYLIKTVVDGIEVEAAVCRSKFYFTVAITKPFKGKETCGPHIPYFLRSFRSFDGEHGDNCVLELLRRLYSEQNTIRLK